MADVLTPVAMIKLESIVNAEQVGDYMRMDGIVWMLMNALILTVVADTSVLTMRVVMNVSVVKVTRLITEINIRVFLYVNQHVLTTECVLGQIDVSALLDMAATCVHPPVTLSALMVVCVRDGINVHAGVDGQAAFVKHRCVKYPV